MISKIDQNFMFMLFHCFQMEAKYFDDSIIWIDKIIDGLENHSADIDATKEQLHELRIWSEDHKKNMQTRVAELHKIKFEEFVEVEPDGPPGFFKTYGSSILG